MACPFHDLTPVNRDPASGATGDVCDSDCCSSNDDNSRDDNSSRARRSSIRDSSSCRYNTVRNTQVHYQN